MSSVQLLAFDVAGLKNIGSKGFEHCVLLKTEPQGFHVPNEPTLPVAYGSKKLGKLVSVSMKPGPVLQLMDVYSPHGLR